MVRRWLDTPIIIWEYDWIPRDILKIIYPSWFTWIRKDEQLMSEEGRRIKNLTVIAIHHSDSRKIGNSQVRWRFVSGDDKPMGVAPSNFPGGTNVQQSSGWNHFPFRLGGGQHEFWGECFFFVGQISVFFWTIQVQSQDSFLVGHVPN